MLVDKPAGPTSHDVVDRVRRALGTRAVGHAGTLDPFATGLLVVLVGRATRLARFVSAQPKTYLATVRLGSATTTDDRTGSPLPAPTPAVGPPSHQAVEAALSGFLGPQKQRPPSFSAKHVQGERSHVRARRGERVEPGEVDIHVHAAALEAYNYPDLRLRLTVSAGTYVRAIARDLGLRLGTLGHVTALRREAVGTLRVVDATPLEAMSEDALLPPLGVLEHLARVEVTDQETIAVRHGRAIRPATAGAIKGLCAVVHAGELIAVGTAHEGSVQPEVVLEAAG